MPSISSWVTSHMQDSPHQENYPMEVPSEAPYLHM
jgi:hypothetical protein